ncbi:unnamed protein product [Leuciscus chuanchicus]
MDSITTAGDCAGSSGGETALVSPWFGRAPLTHTHTPHTPIAETRLGLNQQPLNREAALLPVSHRSLVSSCEGTSISLLS